ncbi:MAG TPA: FtsX-like permease family protein [Phycisphaerae bacterium]|nr:FtsX-like permease family protein [Phycisphaerae bacterium]HRY71409.1 FtsX-like permease family protein [Phycisphaerae bacterium]HSA29904.1 FtsX-like permease family protein [Phycisphaerae bacterium]
MNAAFAYICRNLARRRTRTVVGTLGIFLTIALLTAIHVGLDSVSTSYIDLVALQAGKADLLISKAGSDPFNPAAFDALEVGSRLGNDARLRGLSPRWFGIVEVQCRGEEHYAVLIGLDPQKERELDISGLSPEPMLQGEACGLSRPLAEKLKAKAGGKVAVRSVKTGSELDLGVENILDRQLLLPQEVRDYVVVNHAVVQSILGETNRAHVLAGAFRESRGYYDARDLHASVLRSKAAGASIAASLGLEYDVRLPKASAITAFQDFTSPLRAVFGVFALLALTITGLLIYSLISVAVEERVREYAILRTLGAKQRDIFRLVLSESFLLCFLGVVPGAFAGLLFARIIVTTVGLAMGAQGVSIPLELGSGTLWFAILGGIALSIGSALIPALHATRWRIVDALDPLRRGQVEPAVAGSVRRPVVVTGLMLSALSVVVFFVLPTALLSGDPSLIGTVVLCLLVSILLGLTLSFIGVLPLIQRLLLRAFGWILGPTAELVGRNLERHQRRHTTTALLFTLSVSMVVFIASLVALASRTALSLVEHTHGADLRIHAYRTGEESLKSELARIEGVKRVSQVRFLHSRSDTGVAYDAVMSDLVGMKSLWIVPFGADADLGEVVYGDQIVYEAGPTSALSDLGTQPVSQAPTTPAAALPTVILSSAVARFLDVQVGDEVQLSFRLGSDRTDARFCIAAICSTMPGLENFRARVARAVGAGILMSLENFNRMTRSAPAEAFQSLYFVRAGGADVQKGAARRIREQFDVRYRFGVQCAAEQKEQARLLYWATQILFGLLLGVAVVIAVFALIASMATTVMERRREIGVLKALGLRRRQLFRLFLGEAVVLTLSAGIAGGAVGFTLAWLFALQASLLMELAVAFTMPYVTFLATLAISILAGALAAHLPTRRLLRNSAAEILRG